jgi:ankyrin repeat protein
VLVELIDLVPEEAADREKLTNNTPLLLNTIYIAPSICKKRYNFTNLGSRECFPLVMLCALDAPTDVLRAVCQAYPPAIVDVVNKTVAFQPSLSSLYRLVEHDAATSYLTAQDANGNTMLHKAIMYGSLDLAKKFVQYCPTLINTKQAESGALPIHLACHHLYQCSVDLIKFLVSKNPRTLREVSKGGLTPVHVAIMSRAGIEVVGFLIEECPHALKFRDNSWARRTPFLHLCGTVNSSLDVFKIVVKNHPGVLHEQGFSKSLSFASINSHLRLSSFSSRRWAKRHSQRHPPMGELHFMLQSFASRQSRQRHCWVSH